jgi:hypothetical protein
VAFSPRGWCESIRSDGPTVEGILIERPSPGNSWSFVVTRASLLEAEGVTTSLANDWEVPQAHVLFVERMARSAA